jgi:hypothetical protein
MKKPRQCKHRFVNGDICGSPAQRGYDHCHFHIRYRRQDDPSEENYELPLLEGRDGVNLLISDIVRGILRNTLDHRKASLALYAAQVVAMNLNRWQKVAEEIEEDEPAEEEKQKEPVMLRILREGLTGATVANGPDAGRPAAEVFAKK